VEEMTTTFSVFRVSPKKCTEGQQSESDIDDDLE